jgi:transcriptional accessory protein Tex/SPT6
MPDFARSIAASLSVNPSQVQAAIELLDDGATIPVIARYHRETNCKKSGRLLASHFCCQEIQFLCWLVLLYVFYQFANRDLIINRTTGC